MPEPYYGNRNYRQYGNLGSGVNMMEGSSIPQGVESLASSLSKLEQQKQLGEAERQQKFQDLIKYDLKDVKGRWQDQAAEKKQSFIDNATEAYRKTQGRPTWQEQKALLGEKDKLEQFAGKSKAVEEWYGEALKTVHDTKDITAKNATAENIKKIRNIGSLEDQYEAIQNNDWIVNPDYDLQTDLLDKIRDGKTSAGYTKMDDYKTQINNLINSQDPAAMGLMGNWMKENQGKTQEDWVNLVAEQRYAGAKRTLPNAGKSSTGGSGANEETNILEPNKFGSVITSGLNKGKGIVLSSVPNPEGGTYSGATIDEIFYDEDGNRKVKISHNIPDQSKEEFVASRRRGKEKNMRKSYPEASDAEIKKAVDDEMDKWVANSLIDVISGGKDQVSRAIVVEDYDVYEPMLRQQGWKVMDWQKPEGGVPSKNTTVETNSLTGSDLN